MNSFENKEDDNEMKNLVESTHLFSSAKSSRKFATILKQFFAIILKQFVKRRNHVFSIFSFASFSFSFRTLISSLKKKIKMISKMKNVKNQTELSSKKIKREKNKNKNKSKKSAKRFASISAFASSLSYAEKKLDLNLK